MTLRCRVNIVPPGSPNCRPQAAFGGAEADPAFLITGGCMVWRVAFGGFLHETNSFAPPPADLDAFATGGGYIPLARGAALPEAARGVNLRHRRRPRPCPPRRLGDRAAPMRLLGVRSSVHFRADFAPIAAHVLVVTAPGAMPLDPADLPWRRIAPDLRLSPLGPVRRERMPRARAG